MWIKITGALSAIIGVLLIAMRFKSAKIKKLSDKVDIQEKITEIQSRHHKDMAKIKKGEEAQIDEKINDINSSDDDRLSKFNKL